MATLVQIYIYIYGMGGLYFGSDNYANPILVNLTVVPKMLGYVWLHTVAYANLTLAKNYFLCVI